MGQRFLWKRSCLLHLGQRVKRAWRTFFLRGRACTARTPLQNRVGPSKHEREALAPRSPPDVVPTVPFCIDESRP